MAEPLKSWERKNTQKSKEFLEKRKSKEIPKGKEKKIRVLDESTTWQIRWKSSQPRKTLKTFSALIKNSDAFLLN